MNAILSSPRNHIPLLALLCAAVNVCFSPASGPPAAFQAAFFLQVVFTLGLYGLFYLALFYGLSLISPRLPLAGVLAWTVLSGGQGVPGFHNYFGGALPAVVLRLAAAGLLLFAALTSRYLDRLLEWRFPRRAWDLLFLLMTLQLFLHLTLVSRFSPIPALAIHLLFLSGYLAYFGLVQRLQIPKVLHAVMHALLAVAFIAGGAVHIRFEPPPMEARGQNFLFITVEGMRSDAVDSAGMPALAAYAREGVFFESLYGVSSLPEANLQALFIRESQGRHSFLGALYPERFIRAAWLPSDAGGDLQALAGEFGRVRTEGWRPYPSRLLLAWAPLRLLFRPGPTGEGLGFASEGGEWLEELSRPFFVWMHVSSPAHTFTRKAVLEAGAGVVPHAEDCRAVYARQLGKLDTALSDLFLRLKRQRYYAKTNVLILGVSGMELFDHGRLGDGQDYYEESVRLPFIWVGPSAPKGMRLKPRVSVLDVFPTLAKMYNLTDNVKKFEGLDIASAFKNIFPADRRFLFAGTRGAPGGRALVCEGYKLVLHGDGHAELFNLDRDPGEKDDRSCVEAGMVEKMKGIARP